MTRTDKQLNAHVIEFWAHEFHSPRFPFTQEAMLRMCHAQNRLRSAQVDAASHLR